MIPSHSDNIQHCQNLHLWVFLKIKYLRIRLLFSDFIWNLIFGHYGSRKLNLKSQNNPNKTLQKLWWILKKSNYFWILSLLYWYTETLLHHSKFWVGYTPVTNWVSLNSLITFYLTNRTLKTVGEMLTFESFSVLFTCIRSHGYQTHAC